MSVRHAILNFSGFFSITSLRNTTQHSMTSNTLRIHFLQYPWCTSDPLQLGFYMGSISQEMQKYEWNKSMNIPVFTVLQVQQCSTVACLCMYVCMYAVLCVWPVQRREKAAGAEQHRPHWQHGSPLIDPVQVASSHISHADGPRRAVHEFISIPDRQTDRQTACLYPALHCGSDLFQLKEHKRWAKQHVCYKS